MPLNVAGKIRGVTEQDLDLELNQRFGETRLSVIRRRALWDSCVVNASETKEATKEATREALWDALNLP